MTIIKILRLWQQGFTSNFLVAVCLLFFAFPQKILASSFSFSNTPETSNVDASFSASVNLQVANSAGKIYYLRAAFFLPTSPSSYFGFTKNNNGEWYNGFPSPIDYTQFYRITMDESSSWTGFLEVKADQNSKNYQGSGDYQFKIGRYTEGGSGPTWSSDSAKITLVGAQSPAPSPSPSPSPISSSVSTPTTTPLASPIKPPPSLKPSADSTSSAGSESSGSQDTIKSSSDTNGKKREVPDEPVLGVYDQSSPNVLSQEQNITKNTTLQESFVKRILPFIFICAGTAFIGFSTYSFFSHDKKRFWFLKKKVSAKIKDNEKG